MSDQLPTLDPPGAHDHRALLMRLITPKRLKENEAFIAATRRPPARCVPGPRRVRVHQRVRQPLHLARHRRPARCPGGGSRGVHRRRSCTGPTARAASVARRRRRWRTTRSSTCTDDSASTSRTVAATLATTCSPGWPRRPSPTDRRPRSSTSSAWRRTSSPPARRRPSACSSAALQLLAERGPELQQRLRDRPRSHPQLRRGDAADGEPGQGRLPPVQGADHGRRRRPARPAPR